MPRHSMRAPLGVLLTTIVALQAAFLPVAAATKPKAEQKSSVVVYVTDTGNKYHRAGCRYLKSSSHAISLEEARKSYEPCKVCKPG